MQLPLAEASKEFLTINTHKGLYQYNRLPFGVASAPAIFQCTLETLLRSVCVYIDDNLITASIYRIYKVDRWYCRNFMTRILGVAKLNLSQDPTSGGPKWTLTLRRTWSSMPGIETSTPSSTITSLGVAKQTMVQTASRFCRSFPWTQLPGSG